MPVLVLAEHDSHGLKDSTLCTVMAACHISMYRDGQIHVLVLGRRLRTVQEQAAHIMGVGKVLVADAAHLASGMAESVAAQVSAVVDPQHYSHILLAANRPGRAIARGLAGRLGGIPINDVRRVLSADAFECGDRPGMAPGVSWVAHGPQVLTVRTSAFEAADRKGGIGSIEWVPAVPAMEQWKEATPWHFSECVSRKLAHMRSATAIWPRFAI